MSTLDDLKRAIELVEAYKSLSLDQQLTGALWGASRERDAWRTAFDWRENVLSRVSFAESYDTCNGVPLDVLRAERDEGMALIREKLR